MGLGRIPTCQAGAKRVGCRQVKVVTKGCWRAPWRRGRDGVVLDGATTVCFGFVLIGCFGMGCRLLGFLWVDVFWWFWVGVDRPSVGPVLGCLGREMDSCSSFQAREITMILFFFSDRRDHKILLVAI